MRVVSFKIPENLLTELDLFCFKTKKTRSEVIREAIEEYLKKVMVHE